MSEENTTEQQAPVIDNIQDDVNRLAMEAEQDSITEQPGPTADPQSQQETKQALSMIIGPMFMMLAPAWSVQESEVDALADAYAALVEKYWPGGLSSFGVELNAALVTIAILAPRIKLPRKAEPEHTEGEDE